MLYAKNLDLKAAELLKGYLILSKTDFNWLWITAYFIA